MRGADLEGAQLDGANLHRAVLKTVILKKADCSNADLTESDLRECNLREATLVNADLRGADLRAAYLWRANLSWAKITGVKVSDNTVLMVDALQRGRQSVNRLLRRNPHHPRPRTRSLPLREMQVKRSVFFPVRMILNLRLHKSLAAVLPAQKIVGRPVISGGSQRARPMSPTTVSNTGS